MKVCIDPGHGGSNTGAVHKGFIEKDYVLLLGRRLKDILLSTYWFTDVKMTREYDMGRDLHERGRVSRGCDLTLVLHVNAARKKPELFSGMRLFRLEGDDKALEACRRMLAAHPVGLGGPTEPAIAEEGGWTERAYNVLRYHESPAILVECGFCTNDHDRRILLSEAGKAGIIASCLVGITSLMTSSSQSGSICI